MSNISKAAGFEGKKCYGPPLVDALFNVNPDEKRANVSIYICILKYGH